MSNSGNYKETQDVWSFQTDLFQKAPDQKSSNQAYGTQWCLCFNKMLVLKTSSTKSLDQVQGLSNNDDKTNTIAY